MNRAKCAHCDFPKKVCICSSISKISSSTHVHIIQHPSESKVTKNTGRLAILSLTNCTMHIGETEEDFKELKQYLQALNKNTYLLYPGEKAIPVESMTTNEKLHIQHLVVIDGTWKKAYKILQLNNWLSDFKQLSFDAAHKTRYQIRKANRDDSLSTIEAIAYSLESIEALNTTPLYNALEAMKRSQLAYMPADVKERYK